MSKISLPLPKVYRLLEDVQLHFHLAKEVQTAHLLDISLKGALVETAQPIANAYKGKICRMHLILGKDGENITMEDTVVHQKDNILVSNAGILMWTA